MTDASAGADLAVADRIALREARRLGVK